MSSVQDIKRQIDITRMNRKSAGEINKVRERKKERERERERLIVRES